MLDEADRMCDMGFLPDIRRILATAAQQRQTLFFSATMPDDIRELADEILIDPATVQIGIIAPVETVSHALYPVAQRHKTQAAIGDARADADRPRADLYAHQAPRPQPGRRPGKAAAIASSALQGNMTQNQRQSGASMAFGNGRYDILVATDIAARGIDISEISHVINFDMPDTVDAYTHRIGRTGRAENTGEALTLATAEDRDTLRAIERLLGEPIEQRTVPGFDYGALDPEMLFYRTPEAQKRGVVGHRTFRPRRRARRH